MSGSDKTSYSRNNLPCVFGTKIHLGPLTVGGSAPIPLRLASCVPTGRVPVGDGVVSGSIFCTLQSTPRGHLSFVQLVNVACDVRSNIHPCTLRRPRPRGDQICLIPGPMYFRRDRYPSVVRAHFGSRCGRRRRGFSNGENGRQ